MSGHKVFKNGIRVDKAKAALIFNLLVPISMKKDRSFLGDASFCRTFIKNLHKVVKPLIKLFFKDTLCVFDESYVKALESSDLC